MYYRVTMHFADHSILSFLEHDVEGHLRDGMWKQPYPNTESDSIVFGLIETYSQSEGSVFAALWEKDEPERVIISEATEDGKAEVIPVHDNPKS